MNKQTRSVPKSFWWSVGSLALMVAGAFGPWASVADFTVHGTDGARDGWVVVGAAGVAALVLLVYVRWRRRSLLVLPLLAGLAGAATAGYDINDLSGVASGTALLFDVPVSTEWGIYLALAGSISLALASVGLLIESRRTDAGPVEAPSGTWGEES